MPAPGIEQELEFLTGIDASGTIVPVSMSTWNGDNPATYGDTSGDTKWGAPTAGTPGGTVTYAFGPAAHWTQAEEAAFKAGLDLWSAVADITFAEVTDPNTADFTFRRGSDGKAFNHKGDKPADPVGSNTLPEPGHGTYISIDTSVDAYSRLGSFSYHGGSGIHTVVHEEGHLLGLGHGGPYNFTSTGSQQFSPYDTLLWTAMSYIKPAASTAKYFDDYPVSGTDWAGSVPRTWMPLDILAAQRLYGAPTATPLDGGQVFGFHCNVATDIHQFFDFSIDPDPVVTLWDAGTHNTLDLSGFSAPSTISLAPGSFSSCDGMVNNVAIAFGTVIETAIGGAGDDVIGGTGVANTLSGHQGDDALGGGAGADRLYGNNGDDQLEGGGGRDLLNGGQGNDTAVYADAAAGVTVHLGTTVAQQTHGAGLDRLVSIENLAGSRFSDVLTGDGGANSLSGSGGNDRIAAGPGNDGVSGGNGNDGIKGGSGNDVLLGGNGNDTLTGGDGADHLSGGAGADVLTGGTGADTFVFDAATGPADRITDFATGTDRIELSSAGFAALAGDGALPDDAFHAGWRATTDDQHIVYRSNGALFYDPDGAGGQHMVHVATLDGHPALTAADFLVI